MAKFKTFFDVYRFRVWTRTTSSFFQRKAEEESEIWSNIYGYIVYDAIQMQVSESLSLNGDHIKSIIPPARSTWTLWEHVFSNELLEEYIKHTKISTQEFKKWILVSSPAGKSVFFLLQMFLVSSSFIFKNSIK